MGKACAVPNCNKLHKTKRSMFKVPSEEIERKKWATAIPEIKNLKASHFICENHFDTAFIHRKYVKYDANGKLIAEHVYQRPQLDASAIPNTPANAGSLPLAVDLKDTVSISTDIQSDALSVSGDCASLKTLPADPESSVSTMPSFLEDHRYCALPVPGSYASSPSLSVVPKSCAPTMRFSVKPLHPVLPVPSSANLQKCPSTVAVSVDYRNSPFIVPDLIGHGNSALSRQSSLHLPISSIDASPMNIDVKAVESSSLHGSSDIVKQPEQLNEVGARNRFEEKPDKVPQNEFATNFRELKISPASLSLEESHALTIPKSWSVSELVTKCGKKMIFSYIIMLPVTDATPVVKKSVSLDLWSGHIYYFVHGKILNLDKDRLLLPQILDKVESLPNILRKFEHMRVCEGIKPIDTSLMNDNGIKDFLNYWRSNKCLLLTKLRKCAECKRVQKVFKQRQVRYSKNPPLIRIRPASNSLDQEKINALKKKLIRERRMKNHAKNRLKLLNEELEKNQQDLAAIRNTSLEEKCNQLNVCGVQKIAVQEIIAAAKTKRSGRRYSENWLMLCMLMNKRSPRYYEFLRKHDIIPLPSQKTIRNYFSITDNKCVFDEKFAEILEKQPVQVRNGFSEVFQL